MSEPRYAFPYLLVSRVRDMRSSPNKNWDALDEMIAAFADLHQHYNDLHYTCTGLIYQNTKLTHENQFMLRLIEKYGIGETA